MSNKTKVLVIEDHLDVRENIAEILELAGYEVVTAANGKEGIKSAIQVLPDVIICDIMMPEMDGYSVLHILSKREDTKYIPFIFLTAKAEKEDFRKGMTMGADDYLVKPFDEKDLLNAVAMRYEKSLSFKNQGVSLNNLNTEAHLHQVLDELWKEAEIKHLHKKEILIEEGDVIRYFYKLNKGSLKQYKTNEDGKEFVTRIISPGEYFAFGAILPRQKSADSVSALQKSEVLLLPIQKLVDALQKDWIFSQFFMKNLSNDNAQLAKRLLDMAYNSVRKKVADALLYVYEQQKSSDNPNFKIHLQRDDLAGIAGTAKETAIRTLADFRAEGLIAIEDRQIRLINIKALANMPN